MKLSWYWRRLRRMSAEEIATRILTMTRQSMWRVSWLRPRAAPVIENGVCVSLPRKSWPQPLPRAARDVVDEAERLLAGEWPVFAVHRTGIDAEPDWFTDPLTGMRAPSDRYCFSIPHRDESVVGNIKYVWEPSRHQETTLLATAWWITGDRRFAERAAAHLVSWWRRNSFLMGVHWTSGIEVGLRLISWTWIRALLSDWDGCAALFEDNTLFAKHLYWHQRYLASFRSCGSSANNHLIAELAGIATAAAAFPWFAESARWMAEAQSALEREAHQQTNDDGMNREQASDYHVFVLDILLAAGLAADMAQASLPSSYWQLVAQMGDALAALLDCRGRPARFGDADDGRCLVVDAPEQVGVSSLLDALSVTVGAQSWWPRAQPSVLREIVASIAHPHPQSRHRLDRAPAVLEDTGCALFREGRGGDEVWLRCDYGPLGFLSIAAHGHADALSIELRLGGVEIFADPGTYCYHGEPEWRRYFKGTRGHNTLSVRDEDQALYGGPFLWLSSPASMLDALDHDDQSGECIWEAHHDGYARLDDPVIYRRRVRLRAQERMIEVEDWITANTAQDVTLSFHLGPDLEVSLDGYVARLSWKDSSGAGRSGVLHLGSELDWSAHRGESHPPLGWYSARFGEKEPITVLVGQGKLAPNLRVRSRFSWAVPQAASQNDFVEAGLSQ